jgi:hypothetical protein
MWWKKLSLIAALALMASFLPGSPASAQATRTWVSGDGDDANPCSLTAPCKTWAGAIAKTVAGGEIDALSPGGFGGVTITKAITLDGGGGQVASVLVSGTNGINVSAGASDVVIIRNLRINGVKSGLNGIQFSSGAQLSVENCDIFGFTKSAINVNATATTGSAELYVTNTYITNSASGISLATAGAQIAAVIDRSDIINMTNNGVATSGSGAMSVTITNSAITSSNVAVTAGGSQSGVNVDSSTLVNNNTVFNAAASGSVIRISNNIIYSNSANFSIAGGATIASTGNNRMTPAGSTTPNGTITQQ